MFLASPAPEGWGDGACQDQPGKPWGKWTASRLEQAAEKALGLDNNNYCWYFRSFHFSTYHIPDAMLTTVYTLHQTLSTTNVCFGGPILQKKETEKLSLQRYLYKVIQLFHLFIHSFKNIYSAPSMDILLLLLLLSRFSRVWLCATP